MQRVSKREIEQALRALVPLSSAAATTARSPSIRTARSTLSIGEDGANADEFAISITRIVRCASRSMARISSLAL